MVGRQVEENHKIRLTLLEAFPSTSENSKLSHYSRRSIGTSYGAPEANLETVWKYQSCWQRSEGSSRNHINLRDGTIRVG